MNTRKKTKSSKSSSLKSNVGLFLILLGGFIVRVWGINFGLPDLHIIDEQGIVYSAFYAAANNLRIADYTNGQLIVYFVAFEYGIYFVIGTLLQLFQNGEEFLISYLRDPTIFFLIARISFAIGGVFAIWVLYLIGKNYFHSRIGYLSAFLLSFSFLHVKESHYVKEDVVSSLFVLICFYFVLRFKKGKIKDYILSGIFFGLAFAAEYKAVVFLPVVFAAHIFQKEIGFKKIFFFAVSSIITFLTINPYYVIEFNRSIESLRAFSLLQSIVYPAHLLGKPIWWWFMFDHIPQGIGYSLFIVGILGFMICAVRGREEKQYFLIPLIPLTFFLTVDLWTKMHYARYAMITLPFFALGGGVFLDFLGRKIRNDKSRTIILIVLAIIIIFPSFLRSITFDYLLTKPDTRAIAKKWIEEIIPAHSKVLVESTLKPEYVSNMNVSLNLDEKSIQKRILDSTERGLQASYLKALLIANKSKVGYNIVSTTHAHIKTDVFTDKKVYQKNVNEYVKEGVQYFVLTSWVQEKISPDFEKSLHSQYVLLKEFRPTDEFKTDPHFIQMDYEALDRVNLFKKDMIFGPVIRVYGLKKDL